ncbi:helix-turn-helix transcriptional regulator [Coprococcus eutactus]|nr:helix-turn-helix transcriptional regulator [Coprococcus eutactus]
MKKDKIPGIRELRQARGLTQEDLGAMCGLAGSAIRRYESGRQTPKKETLNRIYNALGVCDTITIGNPDDTPASEVVGDNVSVDVQEDEEVYSVTKKELMAMAYDVMDDLLYTCASKDEMMVMNFALDRLINEITRK